MARAERDNVRKHVDPASLLVIVLTLVLFLAALVVKGIGHDLLLEAGVFLVSVKLIMMAYKGSVTTESLAKELAAIRASVDRLESQLAERRPSVAPADPASGERRRERSAPGLEDRPR